MLWHTRQADNSPGAVSHLWHHAYAKMQISFGPCVHLSSGILKGEHGTVHDTFVQAAACLHLLEHLEMSVFRAFASPSVHVHVDMLKSMPHALASRLYATLEK